MNQPTVTVASCDPTSLAAAEMADALWEEIQHRYAFRAPSRFDPAEFVGPVGGFWLATSHGRPVGSVALRPLSADAAELDVMYVAPDHRGTGVAQELLAALEAHARKVGVQILRLRAGQPQPEALAFYAAAGFTPVPPFGVWVDDETAVCLEKSLSAPR